MVISLVEQVLHLAACPFFPVHQPDLFLFTWTSSSFLPSTYPWNTYCVVSSDMAEPRQLLSFDGGEQWFLWIHQAGTSIAFILCSLHEIRSSRFKHSISNAWTRLSVSVSMVHVSHPYIRIWMTRDLYSHHVVTKADISYAPYSAQPGQSLLWSWDECPPCTVILGGRSTRVLQALYLFNIFFRSMQIFPFFLHTAVHQEFDLVHAALSYVLALFSSSAWR